MALRQCAILNGAETVACASLSYMTTPHRTELQRLMLQTQRDLAAQTQLRTLLAVAEKAVADDRLQLRAVKELIKRRRHYRS
jgi:hypothetical protein